VAERLKQAATDGRILAHEFEERLAAALRARTYGDLDDVVADLPGVRLARPTAAARSRQLIRAHPVLGVALIAAASLVVLLIAAVVIAGLFALAGVWILIGVLTTMRRGRHGARLPTGRYTRRGPQERIGERGPGGAWRY
jgi:Flp pilus assembly protein TadB